MIDRLDEILRRASVIDVLRLAGREPQTRPGALIACPLPGHGDGTPSFSVKRSGAGWRCFGCGRAGGVLDLAVGLELAPDRAAALELLAARSGLVRDDRPGLWRDARATTRRHIAATFAPAPATAASVTAAERENVRAALRGAVPTAGTPGAAYLERRGIASDAATAQGVRYHRVWLGRGPAVIFELRDREGNIVAAQGRFIDSVAGPKTLSRGAVRAGVFATAGALDRRLGASAVAIVEAPIDALSLAVSELPAIALCGATVRPPWLRRELAYADIVLALDADRAGDAAAAEIARWLDVGTRSRRLELPAGFKDTNALLVTDPDALLTIARKMRTFATS